MTIKMLKETLKDFSYEIKRYEKDEYVAFRGDRVSGMLIISKGILNAQMLDENGKIQVIERLKEGTVVASAFIFGDHNFFPVDLFTESAVEIIYIEKKIIAKFLSSNEEFLEIFLAEISNKAQFLSEKLWKNFSANSIREKMKEYIEKNRVGNKIVISSVKELAESFAVARPSVSRVIKEMIDENIIRRENRNTYIIL